MSEQTQLSEYFAAIQPALLEWEQAWRAAKKAIRIPSKVGGTKWIETGRQMAHIAELDEAVAAALASIAPPERLRKVHTGLVGALRINAKSFSANARDMQAGLRLNEWSTFKSGTGDAARFKRLVNEWRQQVKAESQRLDVPIPFRRLWVFRHSL